jgi:hypothetical protein
MLYHFKGPRTFEGKFDPVRKPRYLVAWGNMGSLAVSGRRRVGGPRAPRRPRGGGP